ncbi:3-oxoacyl-ACP reductase [Tabrizicola sp. TH137]|uniref:SDR family NAD(P)-dependent oxidoreductase n=1 Tax=Tabrizicola sp. TH137 TaxID=2067452 RepID=UPI000C7C05C2|nr:SDR family oxidoreductase [Tabrizicola sp. TH137]PLL10387.1 3-oxoacyl-ACP reductase [Tabrizicola sp. TH137]
MTAIHGFTADLFAGRQVVVTGAAGGIGQAIMAAFAACEATTIGIDRAEAVPQGAPDWIACDLADRADLARAAAAITGPVAALIHCAGVFRRVPLDDATTVAEWDRTLAVNLTAPFLMTRALVPQLAGGAIVTVTSVRASTSARRAAAYTASKGGLAALTLALADELAPLGIRANAVAPGDVDTAMGRSDPAMTQKLIARTPLGRMARPMEVAAACVYLASPLAAYITGTTLHVDGGFLAV